MSKVLKTVAIVAGAVALVATGVGAIAGVGLLGAAGAAGTATIAGLSLGTIATIGSVAGLVAGLASIGAALTMKKPPARGSMTDVLIAVDPPQPYLMGRTYSSGVLRHDAAYGGKIDDVHNPYLAKILVYSGSGPIEAIESRQFDYQPVPSWYSDHFRYTQQLGLRPQPAALTSPYGTVTNWGNAYKLSGQAAVLWNFKFDKKGKRYASGIPPYGIIAKGVKVYDPRLDSTYAGGSGTHRIDNEATWTYSENPALHALTYIIGRKMNGKKTFGIGMPSSGIDIIKFVAWANVCDLNGWKIGGTIFEPDGNSGYRWANLKDIMVAGGAEPVFSGGRISVRYRAPVVALETVTEHDLADGEIQVVGMQSYRDRLNSIIPKYRSEAHNWQYIPAEEVSVTDYVAADGEKKTREQQYNLVQQLLQASQLGAYEIVDSREMGPITITLKPQWRRYSAGDCIHLDLPSAELDHDVIILTKKFDPATMTVTFTCVTETAGKHAFALMQSPIPPEPVGLSDPEDRDVTMSDPYVANLPDLTTEDGVLLDGVVDTPQIVPYAVTLPVLTNGTSKTIPASGAEITLVETGILTIANAPDFGSLLYAFYGTMEVGSSFAPDADATGVIRVYVDYLSGAGWSLMGEQNLGINTLDARSYFWMPASVVGIAPNTQQVKVRVTAASTPGPTPGSNSYRAFRFEEPILSVQGIKR